MRGGRPVYLTQRERFLIKAKIKDFKHCWVWEGAGHPTGYGRFGMTNDNVTFSHRASWQLFRGDIPTGMFVCHKCDVRLCVNPYHLFIGTAKDNMHDASMKGRIRVPLESHMSNENHQVSKLTNKQVLYIRRSRYDNKTLAKTFGVTPACIWAARTMRTFRDL